MHSGPNDALGFAAKGYDVSIFCRNWWTDVQLLVPSHI